MHPRYNKSTGRMLGLTQLWQIPLGSAWGSTSDLGVGEASFVAFLLYPLGIVLGAAIVGVILWLRKLPWGESDDSFDDD